MTAPHSRREFLTQSGSLVAVTAVAADSASAPHAVAEFRSSWHQSADRVWLEAEFWAGPLQDWRVANGRAECVNAAVGRTVQCLTRQLGSSSGDLQMKVQMGRQDGGVLASGKGSAGFRVGIRGPLGDYRNNLLHGRGLDAGITSDGGLFIGEVKTAKSGTVDANRSVIELRLTAEPLGDGYTLKLAAHDPESGRSLGAVERKGVRAEQLVGNLALVANFGDQGLIPAKPNPKPTGTGTGRWWFADWTIAGSKVEVHEEQVFGPILFTQYTLSGGVLKLTAQMPPLGPKDDTQVRFQVRRGTTWQTMATVPIHPEARTATFRIPNWVSSQDVSYRVAYTLRQREAEREHFWEGTIRRDPVDQPILTVADISCNIHAAFPNDRYVRNMARLNPDLLAFTGDQFYESTAGYGVQRTPLDAAILDYLRKWYVHGWTWRELTRDRPSISIPDDHDVYQGNIWGESGAPRRGTQEMGGYDLPGAWVNVVHRTQTSHHPDPADPAAVTQGISVYFGSLTYGRISFAILADRQFKSAPEGKVPPTGGRGDHVRDPKFDPKTADLPGLQLLGERQMKFLRGWVLNWHGAEMKAVISQTIFTAMATTHGGARERLRADYDTNAWPQSARNAALREMRKAFAFHLAGDQHLPAVVHYGIDGPRDAGVAFAGPAVNVGYPRWWEPEQEGKNRRSGAPANTGDFIDHFGHPLTVLAVANGAVQPRGPVLEAMHDKASGLGLVRFDKVQRRIIIECWPFLADPTDPKSQFPGWPVIIEQRQNDGRKPIGTLPTLKISGAENPVIQVTEERTGEVVHVLRIQGREWRPPVFAPGKYTVRVSDLDTGRWQEVTSLEPAGADAVREVPL